MDNGDFDFDGEGLELAVLWSISVKALKNAFEPCATNEVTNLGIFGNKAMSFLSLHSRLHSQLFSSLSFRNCYLERGWFSSEGGPKFYFRNNFDSMAVELFRMYTHFFSNIKYRFFS